MKRKSRSRIVGVIIGIAVAGGLGGWIVGKNVSRWTLHRDVSPEAASKVASSPPLPISQVVRKQKFAGSASCRECHAEISEKYHLSGMGQSVSRIGDETPLEDYTGKNSFSPDGHHIYSVVRTDEGVFHHERLVDDEGQTIYDQQVKIDFVVGSGLQGRSYLIRRSGMLFMSPIGWYSKAGKWDLSPGYKLPSHRRFDRRILFACMECHTGLMNLTDRVDLFGEEPFEEIPIGCERCHGSGVEHIRFHRHEEEFAADPIVNPAKLDPSRREDVCSQCHLSGEGRFLRDGCQFGGFQPGTRLEENYLIFVRGVRTTDDAKTRAVSQVEQMRVSQCYLESAGRMGCTSCHDPHAQPTPDRRTDFYRERCLACHTDQDCSLTEVDRRARESNDSCVACHMPRLDASDVPHTTQTDHRILRLPGEPSSQANQASEMLELFDGAEQRLPRSVVDRAKGLWMAERAERSTDQSLATAASRLLERVLRERPNDPDVLNSLGTSAAVKRRFPEALSYWNATLALDPDREMTLATTATLLLNQGNADAGRQMLERYLKAQPYNGGAWGRYSSLLSQPDELEDAINAARKSIDLDPSNPKTYWRLAQLYEQRGDKAQAKLYRDLAQRVQRNKTPR